MSRPTRELARTAWRRVRQRQAQRGASGPGPTGTISLDYPVNAVPRYGYDRPAHPELSRLLAAGQGDYGGTLDSFLRHKDQLRAIPLDAVDARQPSWHNGWFQGLDAVALYCLLAEHRPARYVEVGSGSSTKFARRAIEDHALATRVRSIDPAPRSEVDELCDEVIRRPLEDVDLDSFSDVSAGDIVFFDDSHRCLTNSDVTVAFLELVPRLPAGVLVHFHDIFLPWDYPPQMSDRFYSEQYLLAAALLYGSRLEVVLPNFFISVTPELHHRLDPIWDGFVWSATATNGLSFWVRTRP